MSAASYLQKARSYLDALCSFVPNRSAGSPGNLLAVVFAVNIDGVGYIRGDTAFSFYEFPEKIAQKARRIFKAYPRMGEGTQWYAGDHMVFVQSGKPAIAFTSGCIAELSAEVLHSPKDTPELVDCTKLVEAADAVKNLIARLEIEEKKA
jgi:aminopeptidase YwaD